MAGKPPRWLAVPTPGRSPYTYPYGRQFRARTALASASSPGTQGPIQACRLMFFLSVQNIGCKANAHRTGEHIKRQEHEAHAGRVSGRAGGGGAGHHHLGAPRASPLSNAGCEAITGSAQQDAPFILQQNRASALLQAPHRDRRNDQAFRQRTCPAARDPSKHTLVQHAAPGLLRSHTLQCPEVHITACAMC